MNRRFSTLIGMAIVAALQLSWKTHSPTGPIPTALPSVVIQTLYSDSVSSVIPFNRVGNLIVVKARVDTTEGNFILDTGAPTLVLNLTYFRYYPIEAKHDEEQTNISGSGSPVQQTKVGEMVFGTLRLYRLTADLTNLGNIENAKGIRVLGLLGLDLFKDCELIIDFEKSLLYLHRITRKEAGTYAHECLRDTAAYRTFSLEFGNSRMMTVAEVAGQKLKLVVDCAAESTILDSRLSDKVLETVTILRRTRVTGPGDSKADALYGTLRRLQMGSRQIDDLPVIIVNLAYTCFSEDICVNGVLGVDFLSQQRIGFNFVKRKMYVWK